MHSFIQTHSFLIVITTCLPMMVSNERVSAVVFGTDVKVWDDSNRLPTRWTLLSAVFGQQTVIAILPLPWQDCCSPIPVAWPPGPPQRNRTPNQQETQALRDPSFTSLGSDGTSKY